MRRHGGWWGTKIRQFRSHVRARIDRRERHELATWLTAAQFGLFESMHPADQRHGLDVVATLRAGGVEDRSVHLAGLLHDAGKGRTGVWPRVAFSLGEAYGSWVWRLVARLPGMATGLVRLRDHSERSAALAEAAGCPSLTVELIRYQDAPRDQQFGRLLQRADEAN